MPSFVSKGVVICMLIFVVSAWMSDNLLKLPALEFGEIWVSSVKHVHTKLQNLVSNVTDIHSYMFYIVLILGFILGYYVYNLLFTPLNRVRILGDIGYIPDGKFSLKDIANSVKRRRLVGEVPPVYPNGWFGVMEGFKLKKGEAKNISILGKLSPCPEATKLEFILKLKIKRHHWLLRKQPIIALYFEFETVLKFYNLRARSRF